MTPNCNAFVKHSGAFSECVVLKIHPRMVTSNRETAHNFKTRLPHLHHGNAELGTFSSSFITLPLITRDFFPRLTTSGARHFPAVVAVWRRAMDKSQLIKRRPKQSDPALGAKQSPIFYPLCPPRAGCVGFPQITRSRLSQRRAAR